MEEILLTMQNQMNKKFDEIDQKFKSIDKRFEIIDKKFEAIDKRFDDLELKIDNMRQEILDRQFLFEQEYGAKIDIILDAVKMQLDQNSVKSEKIRELDNRIDKVELNIFNHESRIHHLEMTTKNLI